MSDLSDLAKKALKEVAEISDESFEHLEAIAEQSRKETQRKLESGEMTIDEILEMSKQYEDDPILRPFIDKVRELAERAKGIE